VRLSDFLLYELPICPNLRYSGLPLDSLFTPLSILPSSGPSESAPQLARGDVSFSFDGTIENRASKNKEEVDLV